jgi:cell pole-organizing protein PopZ
MSDQTAQEPTMEEILASIRRIISEDDPPADGAPAAAAAEAAPVEDSPALMDETPSVQEEEVLELTTPYEEPTAFSPPPEVETIGDIEAAPRPPEPAPAPVVDYKPEPAPEPYRAPRVESEISTLVSDRTADSAASAFAGLASSLLVPANGRTLEDVIKELMRPMLRDWLDQNLPGIVENEVRAEVERIARRGAR